MVPRDDTARFVSHLVLHIRMTDVFELGGGRGQGRMPSFVETGSAWRDFPCFMNCSLYSKVMISSIINIVRWEKKKLSKETARTHVRLMKTHSCLLIVGSGVDQLLSQWRHPQHLFVSGVSISEALVSEAINRNSSSLSCTSTTVCAEEGRARIETHVLTLLLLNNASGAYTSIILNS